MGDVRAHVTIRGRVQGVCFRMETQLAARQRRVTGWVKNLPDRRVEAVFEGDKKNVASILKWCETGPTMARVDNVSVDWETYTGEFGDFRITY